VFGNGSQKVCAERQRKEETKQENHVAADDGAERKR
jgi:hypothetical protein